MTSDRVVRALRRAWRDNRSAWRRRVRWYEYRADDGLSIRLNFHERLYPTSPRDTWIEVNLFFDSDAEAEAVVFEFVQGARAIALRDQYE